jgi:Protein of unknown function (DUF3102)
MKLVSLNVDDEASIIRELFGSALSNYLEIGKRLHACKLSIPHGKWRSWLDTEFKCSERTAQRYIRVWKHLDKNPPRDADFNLSLREAEKGFRKPRQIEHKSDSKDNSKSKIKPVMEVIPPEKDGKIKGLVEEIKRLQMILSTYESDDRNRKFNLMKERLEFLESMQGEYEFIKGSYLAVKGLIMEHDPEYWLEIVKILGKKKIY